MMENSTTVQVDTEATMIYEEVLAKRKVILGHNDLDTLMSMQDLAESYY